MCKHEDDVLVVKAARAEGEYSRDHYRVCHIKTRKASQLVSKCFIAYHVNYTAKHMPEHLVLAPNRFCLVLRRDVALLPTSRDRQSPGECERAESVHYLVIAQKSVHYAI